MKKMKKIASLIMAIITVLAMTSSVLAAKITISGGALGSEYAAYKLLDASVSATDDSKVTYTVNSKYQSILSEVTSKSTSDDIVKYISELDTAEKIRTFADAVYAKIVATEGMLADAATTNNVFDNVASGYYLVAETKTGSEQDTYSLVMLDTAKNSDITINTKEDTPKLEKKVKDVNDSTGYVTGWQDSADADVGDEIEYKLTGTVSNKIGNYKSYYYEFHDVMTHLTYVDNSAEIVIKNGETEKKVTSAFTVGWNAGSKTLTAVCNDLKKLEGVTVNADSKVIVYYSATLDANAVVGATGNPNTAYLEYNNNPYYDGDGKPEETGKTPTDTNIVFTYKTVINKVDENKKPLNGAKFTLEKFVKNVSGESTYKNEKGNWVQKSTVETKPETIFTFSGLDDGYYRLTETAHPAGYNQISPIYFTVEATHDAESDDPKLTALSGNAENGEITFTADKEKGSLSTDVENKSGSTLPSTGGMGTTIFYVVGSILVLGAAILLITKKRMSAR